MQIAYGYTRFVVSIGAYAFKFARFPILLFFPRVILNFFSKNKKILFYKDFKKFSEAAKSYLLRGKIANNREYEYSKNFSSQDNRIMPVLKRFLGGWLIIQPFGEVISEEEFENEYFLDTRFQEASKSHQFRRHKNGKMLLVDYADAETYSLLILDNIQEAA